MGLQQREDGGTRPSPIARTRQQDARDVDGKPRWELAAVSMLGNQ
jgi:hypothetical protein